MFGKSKEELWEAYRKGEMDVDKYFELLDQLKEQEARQAELEKAEGMALEIENLIVALGGSKPKRNLGQIANPFAGETKNLTNAMAILGKAKKGDNRAIELAKYLHQQAGLVAPDFLRSIAERDSQRSAEAERMRQATEEMARANDRISGYDRNTPWAFPEMKGRGPIPHQGIR